MRYKALFFHNPSLFFNFFYFSPRYLKFAHNAHAQYPGTGIRTLAPPKYKYLQSTGI
jgi:hypothetical protein